MAHPLRYQVFLKSSDKYSIRELIMTKAKHRKNKQKNLEQKQTYQDICNERPIWANDEKQDEHDLNWLANFKAEVKEAISNRNQEVTVGMAFAS